MRSYTQERCWRRRLRPNSCTYRCYVMAQLKFVCACATTALYMGGSRQSNTETDGQAVKTDFRSRSKGQGQFLTVKNLYRGRERTYDKYLSDHPFPCYCDYTVFSYASTRCQSRKSASRGGSYTMLRPPHADRLLTRPLNPPHIYVRGLTHNTHAHR